MKESRLFKIVYYLLHKGHATAPELAEKFEVSIRTIYRDVDKLSGAGIPVFAEAGRNGGIYLMNSFVLDKAVLSDSEKQEILTALQSVNVTNSFDSNHTINKLSAIFNVRTENWIEVDFSRWNNNQKDNEKFELLKSAIINKKAVRINYVGSNESYALRKIYPLKLLYKSKAWYVKAYCVEKEDYRIFKLTRILDFNILDENFSKFVFTKQKESAVQEYTNIKLLFSKEMSYRVFDEFQRTDITWLENGALLVTTRIPLDSWFVGFLLSFGSHVEIIEPKYIKKILAEQAFKIYEKNKY
ncbi:YafY family protein [Clostridium sp. E02]|uniref:helix-turn-helix transcriptional regulator n=1 Tax=Clostridium sp. E02 TaxID=2487134 RepID=UPI000F54015D|nr:YafY family protein [Clostridium sp. E02]